MGRGARQSDNLPERFRQAPGAGQRFHPNPAILNLEAEKLAQTLLNHGILGAAAHSILVKHCKLTEEEAQDLTNQGALPAAELLANELEALLAGHTLTAINVQALKGLGNALRTQITGAQRTLPLDKVEATFPEEDELQTLIQDFSLKNVSNELGDDFNSFLEQRIHRLLAYAAQFEEGECPGIISFTDMLGTVAKKGKMPAARLLLEDFFYVISQFSDVIEHQVQAERPNLSTIAKVAVEHDASTEAMKVLTRYQPAYEALRIKGSAEVYELLGEANSVRISLLDQLPSQLQTLRDHGLNPTDLTKLLSCVEVDGRQDFLMELVESPEIVEIYKATKKHGVTPKRFAEVVENIAPIKWGEENPETFMQTAYQASQKRATARGAAVLIQEAELFLSSPEFADRIRNIAAHYDESAVIFEGLAIALTKSELPLAEALIRLGEEGPCQTTVRSQRNELLKASNKALDRILDGRAISIALAKEREMEICPTTPESSTSAAPKIHWVDWMLSSLNPVEISVSLEDVKKTASILERLGSRPKLRVIWRMQNQSIGSFCKDVLSYAHTKVFKNILNSNTLFQMYRQALQSNPKRLHQRLGELVQEEREGLHSSIELRQEVRKLLEPKDSSAEETLPASDSENESPTSRTHSIAPFERVIVWGGNFSNEAKARICEELADLDLSFFDKDLKTRSLPQLSSEDLVIFATGALGHSEFYRLKNKIAVSNAQRRYISTTGVPPFIEFVQNLSHQVQ